MRPQLEKEKDLIFVGGRRGSRCNPHVTMTLVTPKKQRGEHEDAGSLLPVGLPRMGSLLFGTRTALSLWTFPPLGANSDLSYTQEVGV